ncbi:MAG TPA: iron dicitrate transport regulator FecR [Planctomycetaceae bacterium]|nr:iron dicitrate transport regulator FecR [Planctomycetaceae bacterium]
MDWNQKIQRYLLGEASEQETAELTHELEENADLRQTFIFASHVDAALRERSLQETLSEVARDDKRELPSQSAKRPSWFFISASAALAATVFVAIGIWINRPETIATIASSENAAWESALPTNVGAGLTAGQLELKRGMSTIKFRSGAEMLVEAPASLRLLSPMRVKLLSGTAVVNVPDSAKGFVLETPNGYAIDYGTRFSVEIDDRGDAADFALIEGKIEVHHAKSGESRMLADSGVSAVVSAKSITVETGDLEEQVKMFPLTLDDDTFRISSNGRCRSVVKFEKFQDRKIFDDFLYVKSGNNPNWDYKSFFQFDVSEVDRDRLTDARLRLNLVPSPFGVASLLPRVNRFAVYGITDTDARQWRDGALWSDAPTPAEGVLLGQFEILRSQERGSFGISNKRLLSFIKEYGDAPVMLLVMRETGKTDGVGKVLVHAFASDTHPESVGPQLELSTN